jgi:hypothetical protein
VKEGRPKTPGTSRRKSKRRIAPVEPWQGGVVDI